MHYSPKDTEGSQAGTWLDVAAIRSEIAGYDSLVPEVVTLTPACTAFGLAAEIAMFEAVRTLKEKGVRKVGWVCGPFRANMTIAAIMHGQFDEYYYIDDARGGMPVFMPGHGLVLAKTTKEVPELGLDAIIYLRENPCCANEAAFIEARDSLGCEIVEIDLYEQFELMCGEQAVIIADQINQLDVDVIYVAEFAYFNLCRQSQALREKGLRTAIIVQHPNSMEGKDVWFDGVFSSYRGVNVLYNILRNTKAPLIHVQGWLTYHFMGVLARSARPDAKVVVEFNDIPELVSDNEFLELAFGDHVAKLDRRSEVLVHQLSDGLIYNVDPRSGDALSEKFESKGEHITFHCYPTRQLCHTDQEYRPPAERQDATKLVFVGSLPPTSHPRELYGDVQLMPMIRELLGLGFEFDVLLPPTHYIDNPAYGDYRYLHDEDKGFRFRNGVYPEQLSETIAGFDYGVMFYRFPEHLRIGKPHFDFMMPSKFYSFLEAGLPILISEEFKYVGSIVREHGLGLTLPQDDITRLDEVLARHDPMEFRSNIEAYRKTIHMEDMIHEVVDFYNSLFGNEAWTTHFKE